VSEFLESLHQNVKYQGNNLSVGYLMDSSITVLHTCKASFIIEADYQQTSWCIFDDSLNRSWNTDFDYGLLHLPDLGMERTVEF
jgi:hypothetical protein